MGLLQFHKVPPILAEFSGTHAPDTVISNGELPNTSISGPDFDRRLLLTGARCRFNDAEFCRRDAGKLQWLMGA